MNIIRSMNRNGLIIWTSLVFLVSVILSILSLSLIDISASGFDAPFSTFVEAGSVTGYRTYQQNNGDNGNHIFNPGETIELYMEPVGFSYTYYNDTLGNTLYSLDFSANVIISNVVGQPLFSIEDVPIRADIDPVLISEVFITLNLTQQTPFLEGDYNITYNITDNVSGQRFTINKIVTIADAASTQRGFPLVIDGMMAPGEWDGIINNTEFAFIDGKAYNVTIALAPANDNISMLTIIEPWDASSVINIPESSSTVVAHLLSSQPDHVEDVAMIEIQHASDSSSSVGNDNGFTYVASDMTLIDGFWDINNPIEYQKDTDYPGGTNNVIAASSIQMPGKQIIEMSHPLCSGDNYDLCMEESLSANTPIYYSVSVGVAAANNTDPTSFYTPFYNVTLLGGQLHIAPSISAGINNIIYQSFESIEEVDKPAPFIIGILSKFDTIVRDAILSNMTEAEREKMLTGPAESDISWFLNSLDAAKLQTFFNALDKNEIVSVLVTLYTTERHTILNRLDKAAIDSVIGKLNDTDRISLFGDPDEAKIANMFR